MNSKIFCFIISMIAARLGLFRQMSAFTKNEMAQQLVRNKQIIQKLKDDLQRLKVASQESGHNTSKEVSALESENATLQNKINELINKIVVSSVLSGERHIFVPSQSAASIVKAMKTALPEESPKPVAAEQPKATQAPPKANLKSDASKKSKADAPKPAPAPQEKKAPAPPSTDTDVHVGRLDLRIGRIVEVEKHPDADTLYVEKVDVGEAKPRTIVSGLVKHVPIEEMQGRLAVFLCNLKPAKMRGVLSEGMIMCASSGQCEVLNVPDGVKPGDRIIVPGFEATPEPQLNPKKKIWETVKPDLKVNAEGIACYRDTPWQVQDGKGIVKAKSITQAPIQ